MRTPLGSLMILWLAGCGRTEPHLVTQQELVTSTRVVVAEQARANVMLLVDRSSSMLTNTSTDAPCPPTLGGCGPRSPCPAGCPTRLSAVQSALAQVLSTRGKQVRLGLTLFPSDAVCGPAGASEVRVHLPASSVSDVDVALQAQADAVIAALSSIDAKGETPTAESLQFLARSGELSDADRPGFVVLLTDGAPDCNAQNAFNCADPVACQCTVDSCTPQNGLCSLGCLDADPSVAAVRALGALGVTTAIIALGPDAASSGAVDTFDRMMAANPPKPFGLQHSCPSGTDAECGPGDACDGATRSCRHRFWRADDTAALTGILESFFGPSPDDSGACDDVLDPAPADPGALSVFVNGAVQRGCASADGCQTWTYADGTLTFHGVTCELLKSSTPTSPVKLEVRFPRP